ncbi:sugar phosphate isomerase/epimerase [Micromonospora noduli]|uniref:Myo-inosose-2 dehydratase n=1 Tax=Micromonospora noduli TaxID=709876 RepID=A0A328N144_9ACTN|nr:sugar phosphate isomerase/epimerase [Micromonospora noduli]KAB1917683.1 sugar phosphate isomerase/epimerase [Micromonospora noduli]RAN96272.1 Myo-inosose-2 dehydratase [Micromonospora noduli]RAO10396.1 Myo-inosose-2 dehydratase [Micromonospora noduli]RAO23653.1 Myo-inosose-2 dehydratase [Micromonospora noduli]RAO40306.1 Myo-inosose-2 dehydratase [Micromonospora noduli]
MDQQLNRPEPTPASEPVSRRGVLRAATVSAAAVGAAGLLGGTAVAAPAASTGQAQGRRRVPVDRISIQLYTLRDQLAADLPGTLDALRRIGYRRVEHAGFVGRTAAQFRAALDEAGLRSTSGHVGIPQPFDAATWEQALADANVVGCKKIVHPYFGRDASGQPIRDPAVYRALARDLNRAGRLAERAGLDFGYHNHQLEFVPLTGGSTGFDILSSQTDSRLVHFELDLYWTWRGAHDPVDVIRANRGRIRQVHVKDLDVEGGFADLGDGVIDFGRIFAHEREAGIEEYIVERDDAGTAPRSPADALDTARVGFDYLASLRY